MHGGEQPRADACRSGPLQVIEVVCCRMTDLQRQVYEHFASSEAARRMLRAAEGGKSKQAPRVHIAGIGRPCCTAGNDCPTSQGFCHM